MPQAPANRKWATIKDVAEQAGVYGNNDSQCTRHLVERLLGLQAPAIAFLTSQVDRKAIFHEYPAAARMETRLFDSDLTVQGGYFGCSRVLGGFDATAIMAANDLMAIGALQSAYDRRIAVPAALSVVGFDNINFAQSTQPALTTVTARRAEGAPSL